MIWKRFCGPGAGLGSDFLQDVDPITTRPDRPRRMALALKKNCFIDFNFKVKDYCLFFVS
jgi:hypothetical protein